MSGSIVSPELRAKIRGMVTPIALGLARVGLTPNALTVIGFLIACVAAVAAGAQAWLLPPGSWSSSAASSTCSTARSPAPRARSASWARSLDSTFDRWGEGVVFVGIAWGAWRWASPVP